MVLLQLEFGEFKSESGVKMPESIVKYLEIPSQIDSKAEAETVDSASGATKDSVSSAMGGNFVINLLLAGSMD